MKNFIDADAAILAGLQIDTLQKVRNGQITLAQWERFNNLTFDGREALCGKNKKPKLLPSAVPAENFIFVVDFSQALEEMIAAGKYDWSNSDITSKRFPIVGVGKVEYDAKLIHHNCTITSADAEGLIKSDDSANPWESAKIEHLLAFGEKFPEVQRKFPIIALGSVAGVDGCRYVPYLSRDVSKRRLDLFLRTYYCHAACRFLVVRKPISVS